MPYSFFIIYIFLRSSILFAINELVIYKCNGILNKPNMANMMK
jgi:hypothetical protein